jgi:hypothetical protein
MTRQAEGGKHTQALQCGGSFEQRNGLRLGEHRNRRCRGQTPACQLCDWHNVSRHPNGHMPRSVATVANHHVCAKHLRILIEIAARAGVCVAHDDVREVA